MSAFVASAGFFAIFLATWFIGWRATKAGMNPAEALCICMIPGGSSLAMAIMTLLMAVAPK